MIGKKMSITEEILSCFPEVEGEVCFYYGNIRSGKTYSATADILELLKRGEVVYANWPIKFEGFDERKSFKYLFWSIIFNRKRFFNYLSGTFHYLNPDSFDISNLSRLVNAHIFIDEGQWIFNSHDRHDDIEKRKLILHNGHYCRSLNIISQRPMNIIKDMRSQINIWYKCSKKMTWPFLIFQREEIQAMKGDEPDETQVLSTKVYFARKKIMEAYNTHAFRLDNAVFCLPEFEIYQVSFFDKIKGLFFR